MVRSDLPPRHGSTGPLGVPSEADPDDGADDRPVLVHRREGEPYRQQADSRGCDYRGDLGCK